MGRHRQLARGNLRQKVARNAPLAQWFRELATMLEAGIPAADAFQKSSLIHHWAGPQALKSLRDGQSLTMALNKNFFPRQSDRVMLQAAEAGGFMPDALKRLAQQAEARDQRVRQIRTRWLLLVAILLIAWFAGAVVAWFSVEATPEVSFPKTIFLNTIVCASVVMVYRWVNQLMCKDGWWWLNAMCRLGWLHKTVAQQIMAAHWLDLLGQQLAAGLDAASSLRNMMRLLPHPPVQVAVRRASELVAQGHALSDVLRETKLITAAEITGALVAGEASGRLAPALLHVAQLADAQLQIRLDELQSWIPRALYVLVVLFALTVIF